MRSLLDSLLRAVSYVFHLGLGLSLVALALVVLLGPDTTFTLGILPWEGRTLAWILLAAGALAIVAAYLAMRRVFALLLLLWSLAVLAVLAWGCFLSRYHFGRNGPALALQLVAVAALAAVGSWRDCRRKKRPRLVGRPFEGSAD